MKHLKFIFMALTIFSCFSFSLEQGDLRVVINGLRNDKGTVYMTVYNDATFFPRQTEKALTASIISAEQSETIFISLPFGEYAVSVFHDENNNGRIDTGFFGIPREGVGASNNKMGIGPPSFMDAVFLFEEKQKTITIDMRYLL